MFPKTTKRLPTQLDWIQILKNLDQQCKKHKELAFKRQGQHQFVIQKRNRLWLPFEQKIFLAEVVCQLNDGDFIYTIGLKLFLKFLLLIDSILLGIIGILIILEGHTLIGFLLLLFLFVMNSVLYIRLKKEIVWLDLQVNEWISICV